MKRVRKMSQILTSALIGYEKRSSRPSKSLRKWRKYCRNFTMKNDFNKAVNIVDICLWCMNRKLDVTDLIWHGPIMLRG